MLSEVIFPAAMDTEFLKKFIDSNPQMKVFGAYIHHDEIGTVHMHLDYVPFSIVNKRGLEIRVSNDKAIEQTGYRNWADINSDEKNMYNRQLNKSITIRQDDLYIVSFLHLYRKEKIR